jgi:hypothetical protein
VVAVGSRDVGRSPGGSGTSGALGSGFAADFEFGGFMSGAVGGVAAG